MGVGLVMHNTVDTLNNQLIQIQKKNDYIISVPKIKKEHMFTGKKCV